MIRVLIVDDQVIVCEGLRVVLNASPNISVVGLAHDGAQALEQVAALRPDLVLMDLKMPLMDGVRATQAISERFPHIPVLILTTYDEDEWVVDAVRAGAAGYLLKDTGRDEIIAAIEGTIAGRTHVDPAVVEKLFGFVKRGTPPKSAIAEQLSERELAILRLLATGLTNADIADRLVLAEGTVRNHVSTILAKLDVTDRAQATAFAWRYGLVGPER
ncbi:MAG: response regulator transcription factor [Chloroflexaceae bacterium]|jgi:DNA-binding NarL/FixJ family response regulator|nr:response regulator transcription factor [Chloroflexaceae bacterium]